MIKNIFLIFSFTFFTSWAFSQKISYSQPVSNDLRSLNFEIIGKIQGNFLVYTNIRNSAAINVYNNSMKLLNTVDLVFMPNKILKVDFITYRDFSWLIYQYQKRDIVYCMAVKINSEGKLLKEPKVLDTTSINFFADNKIYNTIASEDKSKIMIYKIQKKNSTFDFTTLLFNDNLQLLHKSNIGTSYQDRKHLFSDFFISNTGTFVFTVGNKSTSRDFIGELKLVTKAPQQDTFLIKPINLSDKYFDEIKLKIDNLNNHFIINSFFYSKKRGNVDGVYVGVFDEDNSELISQNFVKLNEPVRESAKDNGSGKIAFNDFFIRDVVLKKDGGFILIAEDFYSQSRGNPWNRYDYLYGYPNYSPYYYNYYSPYSYGSYGRRFYNNNSQQYYYNNILVLSINNKGSVEWNNVIHKTQYDDGDDNYLSYALMMTGGQMHFLFNELERRNQLINDRSITASGKLNRNPPLKSLDKGYEFMPRYAEQVSFDEIIVPCTYRNYLCFAKIEY